MILDFRTITIQDREAITAFTLASKYNNCDFAFANMCSWIFLYDSKFCITNNFLFLRFYVEDKGRRHLAYMFPVAATTESITSRESIEYRLKEAILMIEKDAGSVGFPLLILGVTPDLKNLLNQIFPDSFTFISERDYYDYIYLREDLVHLTGKKFQAKRNHINKFRKLYEYQYVPLTNEHASECMLLEQKWFNENASDNDRAALLHERKSMSFALQHFEELGLSGGSIKISDKIVAFTYGSPINTTTF